MTFRHNVDNQPKVSVCNDIAIVGVGLNSVAGTHPVDLLGAVATHFGYTRPHFSTRTTAFTKKPLEQVMTCAIYDFDDEDMHHRFMLCMLPALNDAINSAKLLNKLEKNILFYLVLPSSDTLRGDCVLINDCHQYLQKELKELGEVEIRIKTTKQSVTEHLMLVSEGLKNGHWDTVLFGAVDSLVHEPTCIQLEKEARIQTTCTLEGVIPGEAAGFIILERQDRKEPESEPILAWLRCLSVQQEPNYGKGDVKRMSGLTQAISSILGTCEMSKDKIDSMILPLGTEHSDLIEWHQTEGMLWTYTGMNNEIGDREKQDSSHIGRELDFPEVLNLSLSLGDIGVASLPVAIILAIARFDFTYPISNRIFALESGDIPFRGAIYLENPVLDKSDNQQLGDAA